MPARERGSNYAMLKRRCFGGPVAFAAAVGRIRVSRADDPEPPYDRPDWIEAQLSQRLIGSGLAIAIAEEAFLRQGERACGSVPERKDSSEILIAMLDRYVDIEAKAEMTATPVQDSRA